VSDDFAAKSARLDSLMLELYGCTFDEFGVQIVERSRQEAYDRGFAAGRKEGQRKAKGRQTSSAAGRPLVMGDDLMKFVTHLIDQRPAGKSIKQTAAHFLDAIKLGSAERGKTLELPSVETVLSTYHARKRRAKAVQ
jgi:hypothetical protein